MLKAKELTRTVRRRRIVDAISFELPEGSTATVLGSSGSGKTTLLRMIMGLDRPDAGELHLGERCLARTGLHVPPETRDISLVFQEFTLFPNLDVADNLAFGLKRPHAEQRHVDDLLELLEIAHLKHRRIDRLSGGEQQRVALARALAVKPRVLLMDEPFSNIDNMLRERLYGRLRARLAEYGMTTLIATHDHKEAFFFSDLIMVMKDGALIDHNPPQLIYERPANAWVAAFFGDANAVEGGLLATLWPTGDWQPGTRYLVRPEAFDTGDPDAADFVAARVDNVVYYGAHQDLAVSLAGGATLKVRAPGPRRITAGERVGIRLHPALDPHPLPDPA